MRKYLGLMGSIGILAATILGVSLGSHPPPPMTVTPAALPAPPAPLPAAVPEIPLPPADAPSPEATPSAEATDAPSPETAEPPAAAALPALTEVKIAEHPIHSVPDEPGPPPPSSQEADQQRRDQHTAAPPTQFALGTAPPAGPRPPRQFGGAAQAISAAALQVEANTIQLYGIKQPETRDRCGSEPGGDCAMMAKQALAGRLGPAGKVTCRVPNPRPDAAISAICLDPAGVDLSGFLITQGLALADTGQSYDYVGAEGIARNLKRGLWQFR